MPRTKRSNFVAIAQAAGMPPENPAESVCDIAHALSHRGLVAADALVVRTDLARRPWTEDATVDHGRIVFGQAIINQHIGDSGDLANINFRQ
jgi:hypothetical protein